MTRKEELVLKLKDQWWRLNNLYYIKDVNGKKIKFKLNQAQTDLYSNKHCYNVILKARQLGFTTFCMIYFLDECLFKRNHSAGVIAHTREISEDLFKNKVKFAYDSLPKLVKDMIPAKQDTARRLEFNNGSSITIGTSLRSGTFQKLLVSEYGKISARYPDKAIEIKTGALNTVHIGQEIFIESTAEGNQGEFFELCETARKLKEENKRLTELDPKLFFYPWYENPEYKLKAEVSINSEMQQYFDKIGNLSPEQKAWYVKKAEQQGDLMKREFPSSPQEAFEQSMEGAIYVNQMTLVRHNNQITHVPHEPTKPVYTFWDLNKGGSDYMSILFFQLIGSQYRFIDYYEACGEDWRHYAKILNSKPYVYKEHVLPHDGNITTIGLGLSNAKKDLESLGVRPIRIVPKTNDLWADITGPCKAILPRCWFDEKNCSQIIKHLDNYRKEWDDKLAQWKEKPRHDESSHGADAFRTFAMGFRERIEEFIPDEMYYREQIADSDYNILDY